MIRTLTFSALLLAALPLSAQSFITLPGFDPTMPGTADVTGIPWGRLTGITAMQRIPGNELDPDRPFITGFAHAADETLAWTGQRVSIAIGHLLPSARCPYAFPDPLTGSLGDFRDLTYFLLDQPLTLQMQADSWFDLPLNGRFTWNGFDDVAIFVTYESSSTTTGFGASIYADGGGRTLNSWSSQIGAATTTADCETGGPLGRVPGSAIRLRVEPRDAWQRNSAQLALDHDGVQTDGQGRPNVIKCLNEETVWNQGGMPGTLHNAIVTIAPLVPRTDPAATILSDDQVLNVDRTHPSAFPLYPDFRPLVPWSVSYPTSATPLTYSAQYYAIDFSSPSLLRLSQPIEVDVRDVSSAIQRGPSGDDTAQAIDLRAPGSCIGDIAFYGTTYDVIHLEVNGRITFGASNMDPTPTLAEAASGPAFFGFWNDLMTRGLGSLTYQFTGSNQLTVVYPNMRYRGDGSSVLSLSLSIATDGTGFMDLSGVTPRTSVAALRPDSAFLGLSPGNGLGIDTGATLFAPGASGAANQPNAMLYDFVPSLVGSTPPGLLPSIVNLTSNGMGMITFDASSSAPTWQGL